MGGKSGPIPSAPLSASRDFEGNVLYLTLKELGCRTSKAPFERRKLIQKLVYVAERVGVDLGYGYRWHIHGPYSSDLARTYYRVGDKEEQELAEKAAHLHLRPEAKQRLADMKAVLGSAIHDPNEMEAIASALYLNTKNLDRLKRLKPHIPDTTWKSAFTKVDRLKLD